MYISEALQYVVTHLLQVYTRVSWPKQGRGYRKERVKKGAPQVPYYLIGKSVVHTEENPFMDYLNLCKKFK